MANIDTLRRLRGHGQCQARCITGVYKDKRCHERAHYELEDGHACCWTHAFTALRQSRPLRWFRKTAV